MLHTLICKVVSSCKYHKGTWYVSNVEWDCYVIVYQMGPYITPWVTLLQSDDVFHLFSDLPLVEIVGHLFPTSPLFICWTLMVFFFSHYWKQSPLDVSTFKGLLCFLWLSVNFFDHLVLVLTFEIPSFIKTHPDCTQHKSSHIKNPVQMN